MPATLATISGEWLLPDGTDLIDAIDYITAVSYNENGRLVGILRDASGGVVFSGRARPKGGTITLPVLPQAGVLPEGAHWRMVLKPRAVADWMPATIDFTLSGDCKWSDLIGTLSGEPIGPSLINQAEEALADALAAAAAAHAERLAAEAAAALAESNAAAASGATDAGMTAIAQDTDTDFAGLLASRDTRPSTASEVTKGLYARTRPTPGGATFRVLKRDPNHLGANGTGRIWGIHSQFAQLGYTDDDGATWQAKAGPFPGALAVQSIEFSNNYMWLLCANTGSRSGEVWRVPLPSANGNPGGVGTDAAANQWGTAIAAGSNGQSLPQATININNGNYFNSGGGTVSVQTSAGMQVVTYTGKTAGTLTGCSGGTGTMSTGGQVLNAFRVFALSGMVNGPGGAAGDGGVNSTFRNACLAVAADESVAYVGEYGAADAAYQFPAITDGIMAAGSSLLYSYSLEACSQMLGLSVTVAGADVSGTNLVATVIEVVALKGAAQAACLRLANPARTTVLAANVTFPSATYGNGSIPGGPSVYRSTNPGAAPGAVTWSKSKTFLQGKHIHSVRLIGGYPWVAIGDLSPGFKDCGIWIGNNPTNPTLWVQRSLAPTGGVPKDPINMLATTIDGKGVVVGESDSSFRDGPLLFADATGVVNRILDKTCTLPQPYAQTMRQLGIDETTGNAYWIGVSEDGSVGPTSCVWMSRKPFTVPVLLEDLGSALDLETVGDPVISHGYFWLGTYRCVLEKFIDQA